MYFARNLHDFLIYFLLTASRQHTHNYKNQNYTQLVQLDCACEMALPAAAGFDVLRCLYGQTLAMCPGRLQ